MKIPTPSKGWLYLGVVAATALTLWGTYSLGSSSGEAHVQQQWDAQKNKDLLAIQKVRDEYSDLETRHRAEMSAVQKELANAETRHRSELDSLAGQYAERVRLSEGRADVYQRQAQGGAAERNRLARHAAELDRSLEAGRRLVAELRATVGLRDEQVKSLAAQIRADRELIK
ncbi:Rz-like spanin [Achromobacter phage JWAlpha]|uniref:Rz/RzI spanin protein n=1 Tax=Achromobacter phage JWAlpha TaxID=1416009 RepID=V9VG39_9CAUD|nr:Rz-like spanin [Achromobacter phage JWAlpha]AHC94031.1 hypothetical protein JJJB_0078 [Achromobacter phage JWAlpha]